ncbi:hypothetical protein MHYP_G00255110 [Metynnis hypsauchen]
MVCRALPMPPVPWVAPPHGAEVAGPGLWANAEVDHVSILRAMDRPSIIAQLWSVCASSSLIGFLLLVSPGQEAFTNQKEGGSEDRVI